MTRISVTALQVIYDWKDYIFMFVWPPAMILHTITVWLTVLVTVDRYCAVCRAVEQYGSSSATLGATRRRVVAVVVLAIVYNSPRFFEHQARIGLSTSDYSSLCLSNGPSGGISNGSCVACDVEILLRRRRHPNAYIRRSPEVSNASQVAATRLR